jgi:hypothetical protein
MKESFELRNKIIRREFFSVDGKKICCEKRKL